MTAPAVRLDRALALLLLSLIVALVMAPAAASAAACPKTSLPEIEDEVMCPICGVPLVNAGGRQAENERDFIRGLVDKCKSKDEIKTALIGEYGDQVLAVPQKQGFGLAAYIVPVVGVALAAAAVAVGALRWRRRRDEDGSADVPSASAEATTEIDADLQRYDL